MIRPIAFMREDAQVIAYVGKLGRYAGMDSFCNETIWNSRSPYAVGIICRGTFRQWLLYIPDDGHDAGYTAGRILPMLLQMLPLLLTIVSFSSEMMFSPVRRCRNMLLLLPIPMNWTVIMLFVSKPVFYRSFVED